MTVQLLPNALAMSEFQGYTGDCTQTAALCCAHVLDPAKFPLSAGTLNALVARSIREGHASAPTGAETLNGVAADLHELGLSVEQHGYELPLSYDWHGRLTTTAGYQPILLQLANGQALLGDEATLHYHAIAVLGHDPAAELYYCADGDNPACAGGKLVAYSLAQLYNAQPCGLIVVSEPAPPPPPAVDLSSVKRDVEALIAQAQATLALLASVA